MYLFRLPFQGGKEVQFLHAFFLHMFVIANVACWKPITNCCHMAKYPEIKADRTIHRNLACREVTMISILFSAIVILCCRSM